MKLKDYEIPQDGMDDGLDQEDLKQYSLKNFSSLAAAREEAPSPNQLSPNPWSSPPAQPNEQSFSQAPNPVQTELNQLALEPYDVQFGAHFNLQQPLYVASSPSQSWKMPRWVVAMVGLFFGSAAVLTIAFSVVLLRDPKAPATAQLAVPTPTAPVATTSAAPAQPGSSSLMKKAPADVPRAPSAPTQQTSAKRDSAGGHRIVVSRHSSVVRRQIRGPRRVASNSTSSSVAPQETETASRRPPKDALDQLLGESSL